jgi:hypothetical protein
MHNENRDSPWLVDFSGKTAKQAEKLPPDIRAAVYILKYALEEFGPERKERRNYSMIVGAGDVHHCHLNNGRPRYVAVWKVIDRKKQMIEIRFIGTHGSVNYKLFK